MLGAFFATGFVVVREEEGGGGALWGVWGRVRDVGKEGTSCVVGAEGQGWSWVWCWWWTVRERKGMGGLRGRLEG